MEFKRWWVLKCKSFAQELTCSKEIHFFKSYDDLRSPKLISLNKFFFWKNSVDFWHRKLTLKVQFRHFLTNWCSPYSQNTTVSFEHVNSWAKSLHFRTHHLWNSTTELTLLCNFYVMTLVVLLVLSHELEFCCNSGPLTRVFIDHTFAFTMDGISKFCQEIFLVENDTISLSKA